jgi:uncharacterized protein (DUF433 family)
MVKLAPPTSPLHVDEHGSIRFAGSRVTLDTIVGFFNSGQTPEQISEGFPTVAKADIYFAISYYLSHRQEIDDYIRQGEAEAEQFAREHPEVFATNLRERLLSRLQQNAGTCRE